MKSIRTAVLGWIAALLFSFPEMPGAATFKLQVASVPDHVFMYFVEDHVLPRIESFLDDKQRSKFVLFRDRQPQPIEFMKSDQFEPLSVDALLPRRSDPWGAAVWDGEPGQLALFRVQGWQSNYQKLKRVAVQTGGTLTRDSGAPYPVFRAGASSGACDRGKLCYTRPGKWNVCGLGETAGRFL